MALLRQQPKVGMGIRMPQTGRRQLFKRSPADPGITQGGIGRPPGMDSPAMPAEDPGAAMRMQNFRRMMTGQSGPAGVQMHPVAPPPPVGQAPGPPPPMVPMTPMPTSMDAPASVSMAPPAPASQPRIAQAQPFTGIGSPANPAGGDAENPTEDKAEGGVEEPIVRKTPNEMASY
jgi:hypothetical protein